MRIGLIDVDGHNFPNIPLMKLSSWHKAHGDHVEWYQPLLSGHMDRVYMAKVFSFTEDYAYPVDTDQLIRGGSGYNIRLRNGVEIWDGSASVLPEKIEHTYPDYALYGIDKTAFGFLSRGCPRQCQFCHVKSKEGRRAYKVADLSEFWNGQPFIEVCDPNILACPEAEDLLQQLAASKAMVNLNQGIDARLLTKKNIEIIKTIKMKYFHFAWDKPEDEDKIIPRLRMFLEIVKPNKRNVLVYCLVNFTSTLDEDFHRIYQLRKLGVQPYVMIYDKEHSDPIYRKIQRWVNAPAIFWSTPKFEEYERK